MPQGTNIVNVHANCSTTGEKVEARIDPKVFNYFFRERIVGTRGPRQAMITLFFQRLYEACVEAKLAPWREDEEVEMKINEVMQRINFNEPMIKTGQRAGKSYRKKEVS